MAERRPSKGVPRGRALRTFLRNACRSDGLRARTVFTLNLEESILEAQESLELGNWKSDNLNPRYRTEDFPGNTVTWTDRTEI